MSNSRLSRLPTWAVGPLRSLKAHVAAIAYAGEGRYCPVCSRSSRRFQPAGLAKRPDAQCPYCGSLERHRLLYLYLLERSDLFDGRAKTMLHVAPERALEARFRESLGDNYLTADLSDPHAMVQMDVTDIHYPDQTFDVIYCSHVLEHILDDRKAMREFYRVLKQNGWAILLVPITVEQTLEDPTIVDPAERLRVYGQSDHVRRYGPDYVDRLRAAGFQVEVLGVAEVVDDPEVSTRMRLTDECGNLYICRKPAQKPA